jgi:hypothetical protein
MSAHTLDHDHDNLLAERAERILREQDRGLEVVLGALLMLGACCLGVLLGAWIS